MAGTLMRRWRGDFTTARQIIELIPDNSQAVDEKKKIAAVVKEGAQQPPNPEILHPENYYTGPLRLCIAKHHQSLSARELTLNFCFRASNTSPCKIRLTFTPK